MRSIANYLILFILLCYSAIAASEEIILVADEWCPYNCEMHAPLKGFMIDIAEEAFAPLGLQVRYKVVPWTRAIREVQDGFSHALVGAGREEVPELVFPKTEQGRALHTFYVLPDTQWRYKGLESLKSIRLGVIQDYSYGNLLNDYIIPNRGSRRVVVLTGDAALTRSIEMLTLGRFDAVIEDHFVFQFHLHQLNQANDYINAGVAYKENVYIAFSPALESSSMYAKQMDDTMVRLRSSGKLQKILLKYGLKDWVNVKTKSK